ncbi:hypothetical protein H8E77_26080 [bacterium]|nr:hypothetical protein [bacterium]
MWHNGYLEQARSDWDAYEALNSALVPDCHTLHYLQMTTEKLSKAFLLAGGADLNVVRKTHRAFTRFLQIAMRNHGLQRELGITASQLRAHVHQLLPIAYEIERLAPALADGGPNAEYPWEAPPSTINVPASYNFPVNSILQLPKGRNLLRLIKVMLDRFYVFFT